MSFVLAGLTEGNGVVEEFENDISELVVEVLDSCIRDLANVLENGISDPVVEDAVVEEPLKNSVVGPSVVVNGNSVEFGAKVAGGRGEADWIKAFNVFPTKTK